MTGTLSRLFQDPVVKIRKGAEQRLEHLQHPGPADRLSVVHSIDGVERRSGNRVLPVDGIVVEPSHQRHFVIG